MEQTEHSSDPAEHPRLARMHLRRAADVGLDDQERREEEAAACANRVDRRT